MNRLYISNSKNLFITIVFFILCGVTFTEMYYNWKDASQDFGFSHFNKMKLPENSLKTIIYTGDSRSGAGIVPDVLNDKIQGYKAFNAGVKGGNIFLLMDYVKSLNQQFGLTIVCVSPASLFGSFVKDSIYSLTKFIDFSTPGNGNLFQRSGSVLTDSYFRKFKFTYGFTELKNIIIYDKISHFFTSNGWESISYFGSTVNYARAYNYYGYKYRILCNSGDSEFLLKNKNKFDAYINDLQKINKVLLIRLPIAPEMKNLEDERFPWFDNFISGIAEKYNTKYINNFSSTFMADENNDWSHLSHNQAIRFSETFADSIKVYLNY